MSKEVKSEDDMQEVSTKVKVIVVLLGLGAIASLTGFMVCYFTHIHPILQAVPK